MKWRFKNEKGYEYHKGYEDGFREGYRKILEHLADKEKNKLEVKMVISLEEKEIVKNLLK